MSLVTVIASEKGNISVLILEQKNWICDCYNTKSEHLQKST